MKPLTFIALLLMLFGLATQAVLADVGEPEYVGTYVARDAASGKYLPLERLTPVSAFRTRGMGFGGGQSTVWVPGERSTVRFHVGQKIQLIFKVASQEQDPQGVIQFFSLIAKGDRRSLPTMDAGGMFSGRAESVAYKYAVPFVANKRGKSFFSVEPATPLAPGEYWISANTITDAFCFGVDP